MSDGADLRIFENRPQGREDGLRIEVAGQVQAAAGEGDVSGGSWTDREGESDEAIARGRPGHRQDVQSAPPGVREGRRERLQLGDGGHRPVVGAHRRRRRRELVQQRLEPQLREQGEAPFPIRALIAVARRVRVHRHVDADADQLAAAVRVLGMLGQGGSELLLRQPGRLLQQPVERAELGDQRPRALLADAGDALDVVAGVSHQGEDVDHLVRPHPELLLHRRLVEPGSVVARVEYPDPIVHELEEVLVAGDDGHVEVRRHRPRGQGPDHVVGLEALAGDDGDPQRRARVVHLGNLLDEVFGHRTPVGLVVGRELVPEGRPLEVERGRDELRGLLGDQLAQHRDEAVHRVRGASVRSRQPANRVIGAIHLGVAVDEEQTRAGGHEVRVSRCSRAEPGPDSRGCALRPGCCASDRLRRAAPGSPGSTAGSAPARSRPSPGPDRRRRG